MAQQSELNLGLDDNVRHPGAYISEELEKRGWTQVDLSQVLGRPIPTVNEIITGKKSVTPEMAIALSRAFGNPASQWAVREANYRVRLASEKAEQSDEDVEIRSKLYGLAPVKEMEKRGWIGRARDVDQLKSELLRFFGNEEMSCDVSALARKADGEFSFSTAQSVWLRQAKRLAEILPVSDYDPSLTWSGLSNVRTLAAKVNTVGSVGRELSALGIRLVIVQALPKTRIDGAAFWLDSKSPVIAISFRYDRIDSFWHTLAHELSHIVNKDAVSVDIDLVGSDRSQQAVMGEVEERADREAVNWLIPEKTLDSFVVRNSGIVSGEKISLFARRLRVHPGIVVGQLQHKGVLGYQQYRKFLVKIRSLIVASCLTDGHGNTRIKFKDNE